MAAMIISAFTHAGGLAATSVVAALTLAASTVVIAPVEPSTVVSTNRLRHSIAAIHRAVGDALTNYSVIDTSATPAHPHAGRTPATRASLVPLESSVSPVANNVTAERTTNCSVFMRAS